MAGRGGGWGRTRVLVRALPASTYVQSPVKLTICYRSCHVVTVFNWLRSAIICFYFLWSTQSPQVGGFYTLRHKCYIKQARRVMVGGIRYPTPEHWPSDHLCRGRGGPHSQEASQQDRASWMILSCRQEMQQSRLKRKAAFLGHVLPLRFDACVASSSYEWTHDFGSATYPMCEEPTSGFVQNES